MRRYVKIVKFQSLQSGSTYACFPRLCVMPDAYCLVPISGGPALAGASWSRPTAAVPTGRLLVERFRGWHTVPTGRLLVERFRGWHDFALGGWVAQFRTQRIEMSTAVPPSFSDPQHGGRCPRNFVVQPSRLLDRKPSPYSATHSHVLVTSHTHRTVPPATAAVPCHPLLRAILGVLQCHPPLRVAGCHPPLCAHDCAIAAIA